MGDELFFQFESQNHIYRQKIFKVTVRLLITSPQVVFGSSFPKN